MNPSTAQARAIVIALAKHGITDVVLAPGSRNTPLSIALFQAQHALKLTVRIDERTAAFTALGMAKRTNRPVAVLCTSGTAAANFYPAVYEAHEAGVPLIVMTADRPDSVRGRGANQTIDQVGMFGSPIRADWDLPLASDQDDVYWELGIAQAVLAAVAREPGGPVFVIGYCMGGNLALALALPGDEHAGGNAADRDVPAVARIGQGAQRRRRTGRHLPRAHPQSAGRRPEGVPADPAGARPLRRFADRAAIAPALPG